MADALDASDELTQLGGCGGAVICAAVPVAEGFADFQEDSEEL